MKTREERYEQMSLFPEEPSVEEQISMETKHLEAQIIDLQMKLTTLESENAYLKNQLEEKEIRHEIELGKLVRKFL